MIEKINKIIHLSSILGKHKHLYPKIDRAIEALKPPKRWAKVRVIRPAQVRIIRPVKRAVEDSITEPTKSRFAKIRGAITGVRSRRLSKALNFGGKVLGGGAKVTAFPFKFSGRLVKNNIYIPINESLDRKIVALEKQHRALIEQVIPDLKEDLKKQLRQAWKSAIDGETAKGKKTGPQSELSDEELENGIALRFEQNTVGHKAGVRTESNALVVSVSDLLVTAFSKVSVNVQEVVQKSATEFLEKKRHYKTDLGVSIGRLRVTSMEAPAVLDDGPN